MAEERTAKLKLKRKKAAAGLGAQVPEIKLPPPPVVDVRQSSAGSWFDEIDLTTAEWLWKQVLIGVSPDLRSIGWGAVPSLSDFTHQVLGTEKNTPAAQTFSIGDRRFEWFPFPAAHLGSASETPPATNLDAKNCENIEMLAGPGLSTPLKQTDQKDQLGCRMVDALEKNAVCCEGQKYDPKKHKSMQDRVLLPSGTSATVKKPMTSQKSFTRNIKAPQSFQKDFTNSTKEPIFEKVSKKSSQERHPSHRSSTKNVKTCESKLSTKRSGHLWPSVTLAKNDKAQTGPTQAERSTQGQPSCSINQLMENISEESANKVTEASGSLESCPICLLQFPKQFTQLDMDSHLAQCLSETTVDVVW